MHMVAEEVPFFDAALLLLCQPAEHLAQMLSQVAVKHLPAAFRDKYDVVLALPFRVA
jgi:hypothetical protein